MKKHETDVLWELVKRVGALEQNISSKVSLGQDVAMLKQKLQSARVQLSLKRRTNLQLRSNIIALTKYIKELEIANNLPPSKS